MKRVCAWCQKELGENQEKQSQSVITHGICEECLAFVQANNPRSLRQFLNSLDAPVLCLDGEVCAVTANDAACRLLGKPLEEIADCLCGGVLECQWSRLPGGCGRTEHCLGCAIRRSVTATLESGLSLLNQPAYLDLKGQDGIERRLRLTVSTERQNDLVLLRLDEVNPSLSGVDSE